MVELFISNKQKEIISLDFVKSRKNGTILKGLNIKTVLEKTDRNSLTPSGLVRLGSAYVNRFHRMLFIFNPCRVGSDEYKGKVVGNNKWYPINPGGI